MDDEYKTTTNNSEADAYWHQQILAFAFSNKLDRSIPFGDHILKNMDKETLDKMLNISIRLNSNTILK